MRMPLILVLALTPTFALAEDYCLRNGAEHPALAVDLATDWQGEVVQFLTVTDGKPQIIPRDNTRKTASFTAKGQTLNFTDATTHSPVALEPANGSKWDFALPGEAPLKAEELLGPMLVSASITCPIEFLPQYFGTSRFGTSALVEFHAYVLTRHHILMVIQLHPTEQATANGLRAVIDFTR